MRVRDKEKQKVYSRNYYARNKDKMKATAVAFNGEVTRRNRAYVTAYLESHPCVDCGEPDIIVLEFDHVRGTKRNNIANMVRRYSLEAIIAEIAKCEVRCANCHRRVTHKRRKTK